MKLSKLLKSNPHLCRFVAVRYVAAACSLSGCVPATAYEQATSAAEVEREGHKRAAEDLVRTESELELVRQERDRLIVEKNDLLAKLQTEETRLAQATLDIENENKATEQQQELVTQLRGELARVGVHVKAYEGEKTELQLDLEENQRALKQKELRVAALEAEVAGLKSNAAQEAVARDQLSGALDELAALQKEVEPAAGAEPKRDETGANNDEGVPSGEGTEQKEAAAQARDDTAKESNDAAEANESTDSAGDEASESSVDAADGPDPDLGPDREGEASDDEVLPVEE